MIRPVQNPLSVITPRVNASVPKASNAPIWPVIPNAQVVQYVSMVFAHAQKMIRHAPLNRLQLRLPVMPAVSLLLSALTVSAFALMASTVMAHRPLACAILLVQINLCASTVSANVPLAKHVSQLHQDAPKAPSPLMANVYAPMASLARA